MIYSEIFEKFTSKQIIKAIAANEQEIRKEWMLQIFKEAGIVEKAEEYLYSSARDYYFGKQCGLLEIDFLY